MHDLSFAGERLSALAPGALWWPSRSVLAAADLHLGKAERQARLGGSLLPPYATDETLDRLEAVLAQTRPKTVVLVGDSFDDRAAAQGLEARHTERLLRMAAGRQWIWIAGNHDPGPVDLPGAHLGEHKVGPLTFRHIAGRDAAPGEISGHYHPKARLRIRGQFIARSCFLADQRRIVLPAFGTYTGGLDIADPAFDRLFPDGATALLTGKRIVPLPRTGTAARAC